MTSGASPDRAAIRGGTARSLIAAVFVVVDVALIALWISVLRTSASHPGVVLASIVTLAVGMGCLIAVIVLGRRGRGEVSVTADRGTAFTVLAAVSVLQMVAGFTAMPVLGAFADPSSLQVFLATMVASVVVLYVGVCLARHVTQTREGVTR